MESHDVCTIQPLQANWETLSDCVDSPSHTTHFPQTSPGRAKHANYIQNTAANILGSEISTGHKLLFISLQNAHNVLADILLSIMEIYSS